MDPSSGFSVRDGQVSVPLVPQGNESKLDGMRGGRGMPESLKSKPSVPSPQTGPFAASQAGATVGASKYVSVPTVAFARTGDGDTGTERVVFRLPTTRAPPTPSPTAPPKSTTVPPGTKPILQPTVAAKSPPIEAPSLGVVVGSDIYHAPELTAKDRALLEAGMSLELGEIDQALVDTAKACIQCMKGMGNPKKLENPEKTLTDLFVKFEKRGIADRGAVVSLFKELSEFAAVCVSCMKEGSDSIKNPEQKLAKCIAVLEKLPKDDSVLDQRRKVVSLLKDLSELAAVCVSCMEEGSGKIKNPEQKLAKCIAILEKSSMKDDSALKPLQEAQKAFQGYDERIARKGVEKAFQMRPQMFEEMQSIMRKFLRPGTCDAIRGGLEEIGVLHSTELTAKIDKKSAVDILCKYIQVTGHNEIIEGGLDDEALANVLLKLADHWFETRVQSFESTAGEKSDLKLTIEQSSSQLEKLKREIDPIGVEQRVLAGRIDKQIALLRAEVEQIRGVIRAPIKQSSLKVLDSGNTIKFFNTDEINALINASISKASNGKVTNLEALVTMKKALIEQNAPVENERAKRLEARTAMDEKEKRSLIAEEESLRKDKSRLPDENTETVRQKLFEIDTKMKSLQGRIKELNQKYKDTKAEVEEEVGDLPQLEEQLKEIDSICQTVAGDFLEACEGEVQTEYKAPKRGLIGQKMDDFMAANGLTIEVKRLAAVRKPLDDEQARLSHEVAQLTFAQTQLKALSKETLLSLGKETPGHRIAERWRADYQITTPKTLGINSKVQVKTFSEKPLDEHVYTVLDHYYMVDVFFKKGK